MKNISLTDFMQQLEQDDIALIETFAELFGQVTVRSVEDICFRMVIERLLKRHDQFLGEKDNQKQYASIDTQITEMNVGDGSFVYLLLDTKNHSLKIGSSKNVTKRLRTLRMASGVGRSLTVLAYYPGDFRKEKLLHRRFQHLRTHGEWFRVDMDIIKYFKEEAKEHGRFNESYLRHSCIQNADILSKKRA